MNMYNILYTWLFSFYICFCATVATIGGESEGENARRIMGFEDSPPRSMISSQLILE